MKVIWAYKNIGGSFGLQNLSFNPSTWALAKASALSWKLYASDVTRVIYVDRGIYEFMKIAELLGSWDEVIVVKSFNKYNQFWANPKAYAQTLQSEPFWIVDPDFVLLDSIDKWFDPSKFWTYGGIDRIGGGYIEGEDVEQIKAFFEDVFVRFPEIEQLVSITNMSNGGSVYYADPVIGTTIGYVLQGVQTYSETVIVPWYENSKIEVPKYTLGSGAIEEEGLIGKLLKTFNVPLGDLNEVTEIGYVRHFWSTDKYNINLLDQKLAPWFDFKQEHKKIVKAIKDYIRSKLV